MAVQKGFNNIGFSRLKDLVNFPVPDKMDEISYVANATNFRRFIMNRFGNDNIDIDHEIETVTDVKMTYLGYRRFLESDLKHIFPLGNGRTNKAYKKDVKFLAKQMLIRGYVSKAQVQHRQFLSLTTWNRLLPVQSRTLSQITYVSPSTNLQASIKYR